MIEIFLSFLNVVEVHLFDDLIDLIPLVSMQIFPVDKRFYDFVVHLNYFVSKFIFIIKKKRKI